MALLGAAGCMLTSGQFNVPVELPSPLDVVGPEGVIRADIDLNQDSIYRDHKQDVQGITDAALLGELTNAGDATEAEIWMTPASTNHSSATSVRLDPTAVPLWGPVSLAAGQVLRLDWDASAGAFVGRSALLEELQGDGTFTLYTFGSAGGSTYHFSLRQGVLLVVIDAAE
jgi:hypothetical protein